MILDRRRRGRPWRQATRCLFASCLLIAGSAPGWAQGQIAPAETTGELSLKSEPNGAVIELIGEHNWMGMTPCTFNRGLKGRYELTAKMRLYERWHRTLNLVAGESREMTIQLTPKTAWKAGFRSAIVPGWGQFYAEEPAKGWILLGATTIAAGGLLWTHLVYEDDVDDYLAARNRYFGSTQYEELDHLRSEMNRMDQRAQDQYEWRQGFLYATAACYVVSFLDAVFFFPSRAEGAFASVRPFGDGGPDLAFRSAPGGSIELAFVLRDGRGGDR